MSKEPIMKDSRRFEELASKWLQGTITETEKMTFSQWYQQELNKPLPIPETFASSEEEIRDRMLAQIKKNMKSSSANKRKRRLSIQWAATVTAFLLVSIWLIYDKQVGYFHQVKAPKNLNTIQAGGNKATLILGNGKSINLRDKQQGIVVDEDIRYADGSTVVTKGALAAQLQLKTPKGGTYQVLLADGTKVWLNAASSLKYPLYFNGKERIVELTGEAYFEVASYKPGKSTSLMPFKVLTQGQRVEVLGTAFNINAYEDETAIKTTLVNGAIRVSNDAQVNTTDTTLQTVLLKPGNQSVLTRAGLHVQKVQPEQFTAWKDGYFDFEDANLYMVMKQFARWYDIDIQYEKVNTDDRFVGRIPRKVNLSTALKALKTAGVNFELIGNRRLLIKAE
ncbi:DUF4974 domain-containing protein [Olivibacter ginsenosidimutans]|uniref:DUF4974 domain-containing protein n=1 Tax=Olivibacter ginsenosidimutans TaxID=1176537 RepID=A0ABP9AD85_9SPHI